MRKFKFAVFSAIISLILIISSVEPLAAAFCLPASGGKRAEEVAEQYEEDRNKVFIGGKIVGFTLDLDGVVVTAIGGVNTEAGFAALKSELREGDRIYSVDGERVTSAFELSAAINRDADKTSFTFGVERAGDDMQITITPLIERVSGRLKLGVEVQEEVSGLGTIVFIKRNGEFAALGHSVSDSGGTRASIRTGWVYGGRVLGVERGTKGKAGSIKGSIVRNEKLGTVESNDDNGLYGVIDEPSGMLYEVGSRDDIVNGKAKIRSEVSGEAEFYEVEISRAGYSSDSNEKGLIVRVTDRRLIALTGGIVQGMSGSPIVQNGKIVGAVTHVFVSDPLRGYGIFADSMKSG